jgi:hypothetical protein
MRIGTNCFVSRHAALRYYKYALATMTDIDRMIAEGEICIGKSNLEIKPGQSLVLIDKGTRYAIEEDGRKRSRK